MYYFLCVLLLLYMGQNLISARSFTDAGLRAFTTLGKFAGLSLR